MPPRHPPGSLSPRQISQIHAHFIKTPQSHILNPLLGALTSSAAPLDALFLYNIMLRHPAAHNHYTFTYALKACSILQARHKGTEIHAGVLKSGHCSDVFIQNSLLHFYFLSNDVVSANRIFGSINFPDVVSWTSFISGLSRCGFEREALDKFAAMDVEPNCATLVSILSACCGLWELNSGRAIHGYVLKNWRRVGVILWNAVLNLYVKCGFIWGARNLFTKMPERDVFSWTTMIGGYALSGFHKDSIELFQEMLQVGPEPNEATVVTALSAYSSSGVITSISSVNVNIAFSSQNAWKFKLQ
ncbi:hypothetical protein SAY87_019459 [Trapa incisa]|uniref:Pentatricopeptide repeat-containing protein n=1 Tax=Trapa incisa TaxID=236973 RepID=A0AAN7JZ98_9MYRT|nr:hypothetical protein SAY87_019459 [Trapa incisa]